MNNLLLPGKWKMALRSFVQLINKFTFSKPFQLSFNPILNFRPSYPSDEFVEVAIFYIPNPLLDAVTELSPAKQKP